MKPIVVALALLALAVGAQSARAEELTAFRVNYVVRAGGVEVGEANYAFTFGEGAYRGAASRRSTGLARALVGNRQDFTYSASGAITDDGQVRPHQYQHQDARGHRVVQVTFAGYDVTTLARPNMNMGDPPATAAQRAGAMDQVSIFAQLLVSAGDPCRQAVKVFMDGRSLFDLALTPNGQQSISSPAFRGRALRCDVQFLPVAGFTEPQTPRRLSFLFAPVQGYFVPLSIEMPTQDVGVVRLDARTFTLIGRR
mgnify:CR=1 FL=1